MKRSPLRSVKVTRIWTFSGKGLGKWWSALEVSLTESWMGSGKRIKVSVPLPRFEPLEILKIKGKISKIYV